MLTNDSEWAFMIVAVRGKSVSIVIRVDLLSLTKNFANWKITSSWQKYLGKATKWMHLKKNFSVQIYIHPWYLVFFFWVTSSVDLVLESIPTVFTLSCSLLWMPCLRNFFLTWFAQGSVFLITSRCYCVVYFLLPCSWLYSEELGFKSFLLSCLYLNCYFGWLMLHISYSIRSEFSVSHHLAPQFCGILPLDVFPICSREFCSNRQIFFWFYHYVLQFRGWTAITTSARNELINLSRRIIHRSRLFYLS